MSRKIEVLTRTLSNARIVDLEAHIRTARNCKPNRKHYNDEFRRRF